MFHSLANDSRLTPLGRRPWLWVLLCLVLWFAALVPRNLLHPDEGRYAEIPREMLASGDWLTPRLNDIKYFEKPPLHYWANAIAFKVFGLHDWTARLSSGLSGLLTLILVGFVARRWWGRAAGLWSAMLLSSMLLFFTMSHFNNLDMMLVLFMTVSLCSFLMLQAAKFNLSTLAPLSDRERLLWKFLLWTGLALGVLTKGLVALVVPCLVLAVWAGLTWRSRPSLSVNLVLLKNLGWPWGPLLFLLVAAPWFVLVSQANPEFPYFFFIHEHFDRYLTKVHGRYEPVWFYGPVLFVATLPWTGLVAAGWWQGLREGGVPRFLALWCLVIVCFFSLSGSKLISYIAPAQPALALLAGAWVPRMPEIHWRRHLLGVASLMGALLIAAAVYYLSGSPPYPTTKFLGYITAAVCLMLAGFILSYFFSRTLPALLAAALAMLTIIHGFSVYNDMYSAYGTVQRLKPILTADTPVYSVRMYDQTLPFYLRRTVTIVDYGGELTMGLEQEPQKALTKNLFLDQWQKTERGIAVMTEEAYTEYKQEKFFPMQYLFRAKKYYVVSRK